VYEDITTDIRTFLASEDVYARRGVPYRRGYLLHGPPGTGKTSLVRVIASELDLPLYVMGTAQLSSESALYDFFTRVTTPSLILLEDIDAYEQTKDRDDKEKAKAVSLAPLLNVLDGVLSREGYIFITTSNHPQKLDAALKRPGRIDRSYELGPVSYTEVEKMFELYYGEKRYLSTLKGRTFIPATVQALFQQCDSAGDAHSRLLEVV
jgi:chaperone BCS1